MRGKKACREQRCRAILFEAPRLLYETAGSFNKSAEELAQRVIAN
jgi:hypothetical protein